MFINIFFVLFKGAKSSLKWPSDKAAWVSGAVGGAVFVLAIFPGIWLLKWIVKRDMEYHARKAAEAEAAKNKEPVDEESAPEPSSKAMKVWNSLKKAATRGLEVDIHEVRTVGSAPTGMTAASMCEQFASVLGPWPSTV